VTGSMRRRLSAACWTLLLGIGLPAGLIRFAGPPIPHHRPRREELLRWLDQPLTGSSLTIALTYLLWLIWALFIAVVLAEALAHLTRIRLPRPRLAYPLHHVVGGLFGAAVVTGTTSPTVVVHATAAADQPADPAQSASSATAHLQRDHAGAVPGRSQPADAVAGSHRPMGPPSTDLALATRLGHELSAAAAAVPSGTGAPSMVLLAGYDQSKVNTDAGRYVVQRGDTLSAIARRHLGDANRWPEICRLNWHRHWPKVGGTLRDCDLIYPGWDLRLPADAKPPKGAPPAPPPPPPVQPEPEPEPGGTGQPTAAPSASTPSEDPDGVVEPPAATASVAPSASVPGAVPPPTTAPPPASATPSASASATASPDASPAASDDETTAAPSAGDDGVNLPGGSFVPWALAAAITAAAAMVWLQRRRRVIPRGEDSDPPELPPPVAELHRQVTRNPDLATPSDLAERAAAVPAQPLLPPGGVGLVGDGAQAAARAALVSTLASGGPRDPDRRGEVVIDGATLSTLIGADAAALGPWPRLHVADDLDHALSILDSRLLHRARILDEHSLTDLDSLRERAPDEEALPPVLLICETPPPGARMRAWVSFGLGAGLDVAALLLGVWEHGCTIAVAADGHTRLVDGSPVEAIGERVAVLDTAEAVAVLATLREAHTGEPPARLLRPPTPPRPAVPVGEADTERDGDDREPAEQLTAEPAVAGERRPKVRLRVLGIPGVEDIRLPGRSLRGKAAELGVYLACHPDGADTAIIAEHLFPEAKVRAAKQSVHTNASNLRHVLGRAGGPLPGGYVLKRGASVRYRLDPATVEVDLWRLRDLLTRARLASAPARTDLLREACEAYAAPLAAGCDYDWVEPHREKVRQWGTEAHLLLAEDLLASDPRAASELLDKAIGLDRYNEELYRTAMHARHALHDADGIRALLRAITKALSDLDAEPDDTTVELAAQLRASLETR